MHKVFRIMDPTRGKQQHFYKSFKLSNYQYNHLDSSNHNVPSTQTYLKTSRVQKHNLKWRKDHHFRGNSRSRYPYKRHDGPGRKANNYKATSNLKSSEDMEEEERKKKLNDTAKKLLSKIKTWNAEQNVSEESNKSKEDSQQTSSVNQVLGDDKFDDIKKRIAHSKKAKLVKNRTPKRLKQPARSTTKYDVNSATLKDFQNRIQHKLIEEIMQMPRENLQSVLNDPKINPIMGQKMSRLVQENRPLITQKLRALAESKMKSLGFTSNPQLLVDIDKLIDPVIETDLSALPYELIKQMENLFQVQFDYSPNISQQCEVGNDVCNTEEEDQKPVVENSSFELLNQLADNTPTEDLSIYECSTDEDEEISAKSPVISFKNFTSEVSSDLSYSQETVEMSTQESNELSRDVEVPVDCDNKGCIPSKSSCMNNKKSSSPKKPERENLTILRIPVVKSNSSTSQSISEERPQAIPSPVCISASSQTESIHSNISTQTTDQFLYGVSLPKESNDNSITSLLEEVNSIQKLTQRLNERRLMIFLELCRRNPEGNSMNNHKIKSNFIETLSNGSEYLAGALDEFFKLQSRQNCGDR